MGKEMMFMRHSAASSYKNEALPVHATKPGKERKGSEVHQLDMMEAFGQMTRAERVSVPNGDNAPGSKLIHGQVVSKKRVLDHGEVYTRQREVQAMLDLVKQETNRIESRFLEPACGTGNFLAEILTRKLNVVELRYARSQLDYERNAVLAVSSVYGIDILEDNVLECRRRLSEIFEKRYVKRFRKTAKADCLRAVRYILDRNITPGDALTLKTVGANPRPIVFSEWSPVNGSMIKRRDFTFHSLLEHGTQGQWFSSDLGEDVFIPSPKRDYPLIHFLRVSDVG